MNKQRQIGWVLLSGILLVGALQGIAWADYGDSTTSAAAQGRMRKLGRGISNMVTAPGELMRTPELVGRREGYLAAMSVGVVEGVWRTLVREVTGIFEVVTFYAEVPKNYEPLMRPEFIWEHGQWVE